MVVDNVVNRNFVLWNIELILLWEEVLDMDENVSSFSELNLTEYFNLMPFSECLVANRKSSLREFDTRLEYLVACTLQETPLNELLKFLGSKTCLILNIRIRKCFSY